MAQQWGLCRDCKWWQIEPDATVADRTMGLCIEEQLQDIKLRISGNGGCTLFGPGKPARAEGSSTKPPKAAPTR